MPGGLASVPTKVGTCRGTPARYPAAMKDDSRFLHDLQQRQTAGEDLKVELSSCLTTPLRRRPKLLSKGAAIHSWVYPDYQYKCIGITEVSAHR